MTAMMKLKALGPSAPHCRRARLNGGRVRSYVSLLSIAGKAYNSIQYPCAIAVDWSLSLNDASPSARKTSCPQHYVDECKAWQTVARRSRSTLVSSTYSTLIDRVHQLCYCMGSSGDGGTMNDNGLVI
nr:hypothetical protein CFP56_43749 [Quercus suber]